MIKGGYIGKLLRVDLSAGTAVPEPLNEAVLRDFIGQLGIGVRMMYDEVPPGVAATDPENRLLFLTGPFTGTRVQAGANFQAISQNPITGCHFAVGNSHGFWGPRLKFAGYDGIIIQGQAAAPVYLWVHDGECEIRDAAHLWGQTDTFEAEDAVQRELGGNKVSVVTIGPAGENGCAAAMIQNEHGHVAAKGNIGTVMGSKRLKAIAVHGTGRVPVADPDRFRRLARKWREDSFKTPFGIMVNTYGTATGVPVIHEAGQLPAMNFKTGVFPEFEKLSGKHIRETHHLKPNPCWGCSLAHCHTMTVTEGPYKGFVGEEPEYEDLANLGSLIGLADSGAVAWLTERVDRLGFDSNWAGSIVSWAMEAYERGILTKELLGGLELNWGDEKAAAELLRMIASRDGVGDTLALGLKKGPEKIGGADAAAFAAHFKGETNHGHDSRAIMGQFLGLCIAGAGPRWESMGLDVRLDPDVSDLTEPLGRYGSAGKAEAAGKTQIKRLFLDTLGVCMFGTVDLKTTLEAYEALTGWSLDAAGALAVGERIANLQRAFNVRHGFVPEMDLDVSPRMLEPPPDGGAAGRTIAPYLAGMVRDYNHYMDWNWQTGRPSRRRLERLGLGDVAADLGV